MLQIDEIRTLREFEALRDTWRELQEAAGARSIFLSHEWFLVCAHCLMQGQQLLVLVLRRGGRPVGAVPLLSQRVRLRHLPARQIGFLENPLTPFVDFLLTEPEEGLAAVLGYFRETRTDWDLLSFAKLRQDSPHLELLPRVLDRQRQTFRVVTVSQTPFLRIQQSWEDFYQSKSQKFKKTRRSVANRIERLGPVTVELLRRPAETARGLEQLLEVSQQSWKRQQAVDLLTPEFERKFFIQLTRVASEAGWLRLWLLKKGEEVLAAEYHLDDHGTVYALRAHYDGAYAASSPGAYLDTKIVRHLFENGCALYDMGPGMVDYKLAWTDSVYRCYGVEIYNQKPYSQLLGRLEARWIPALKASPLGRWLEKRAERTE